MKQEKYHSQFGFIVTFVGIVKFRSRFCSQKYTSIDIHMVHRMQTVRRYGVIRRASEARLSHDRAVVVMRGGLNRSFRYFSWGISVFLKRSVWTDLNMDRFDSLNKICRSGLFFNWAPNTDYRKIHRNKIRIHFIDLQTTIVTWLPWPSFNV